MRGEHDAKAVGAGLLKQRKHRFFAGRVGDRRKVAEDLVHVEHGSQAAGAGLGTHPTDHFVEQDRDEKHPLGFAQVGDRKNRQLRPAFLGVQQFLDVERFAF